MEKPQIVNLAGGQVAKLRATIKVSSTEEGAIFGSITYEKQHGAPAEVISLAEVKIDVVEHIKPEKTSVGQFREMWGKFE